jgi:tRNA U34 5-methylaminomethyl-2-thiouridine-forming methyltransferase MnmC
LSDPYQLVQLANGSFSIRSLADGETFHPVAGPITEAEALYVRQLRLRDRLQSCPEEFVIWDVGLGAAANTLVALRCTTDISAPVHIISFDRTTAALEFALKHANELGYVAPFAAEVRQLLATGSARFQNGAQTVQWNTVIGDFPSMLAARSQESIPSPDAIFFDAFSPARNPDMWTLDVLSRLHACLDPARPCSLATFSRSTVARTALLLAGFFVGAGEALAGKEETTVAANACELVPRLLDRQWLERARRSHSAEPLHSPEYVQKPLAPDTWQRLRAHPQFS